MSFHLLDEAQAAERLGCSVESLQALYRSRRLEGVRLSGRVFAIENEVDAFKASGEPIAMPLPPEPSQLSREEEDRELARINAQAAAAWALRYPPRERARKPDKPVRLPRPAQVGKPLKVRRSGEAYLLRAANDVYYIHWSHGRRSRRISAKTTDRDAAERALFVFNASRPTASVANRPVVGAHLVAGELGEQSWALVLLVT